MSSIHHTIESVAAEQQRQRAAAEQAARVNYARLVREAAATPAAGERDVRTLLAAGEAIGLDPSDVSADVRAMTALAKTEASLARYRASLADFPPAAELEAAAKALRLDMAATAARFGRACEAADQRARARADAERSVQAAANEADAARRAAARALVGAEEGEAADAKGNSR